MVVVGYILVSLILVASIIALALFARFLLLHNYHPCPKCLHSMDFLREEERSGGNVYLFKCPNCGEEEEIKDTEMDAQFYNWMNHFNNTYYG